MLSLTFVKLCTSFFFLKPSVHVMFSEYPVQSGAVGVGSPRGHKPLLHRHLPGWTAAARSEEMH